jgi:hypothetical protein
VILGFIADLRCAQQISFPLSPIGEHIGKKSSRRARIQEDGGKWIRFAHHHPLPGLSPAQKFAIDLADFLYDLAKSMVVSQGFRDLPLRILRNVIHLRTPSRMTYGEVILWAMTGPASAFASCFAARFVAFDERTAEQAIERGELV